MIYLIIFIIVSVAITAFMGIRNEWVFRVRTEMIDNDLDAYHRLPSYDRMFKTFWIWDVNKFLNQSQHSNHN